MIVNKEYVVAKKDLTREFNSLSDREKFERLMEDVKTRYPYVHKQLNLLIGYPEFGMMIKKFLVTDRDGRQGFNPETVQDLLKLDEMHRAAYNV
jgi:arsenate reductase-like glutaredoxin family protein